MHACYIRISRDKKNSPRGGQIKPRFKRDRVAKLDRNCKKAPVAIRIEFLIGAERFFFYCNPVARNLAVLRFNEPSLLFSLSPKDPSVNPLFLSSFSPSRSLEVHERSKNRRERFLLPLSVFLFSFFLFKSTLPRSPSDLRRTWQRFRVHSCVLVAHVRVTFRFSCLSRRRLSLSLSLERALSPLFLSPSSVVVDAQQGV